MIYPRITAATTQTVSDVGEAEHSIWRSSVAEFFRTDCFLSESNKVYTIFIQCL